MQLKKNGLLKIGVLSAFMMLIIMLPSMLQNHGIYIIRGDYVDQYIPRLIRSREILMSGGATWDWFNFLGASFNKINILFSTNAICLLFPSHLIPYAVTYLHLIRFAMIAMAAYAYLRYMVKNERNAFLGALLYTFSSYTFVNFEFMQFLETLWVFPLLLLSVELMFREENYRYQLILMAFLSCCISFYFFVFSTLWFGIYFLCRFFGAEEWKGKRDTKHFLLAVAEYCIGFLCAFLVFAPFLYSLFYSSGSAEKIGTGSRNPILYFFDSKVLARFFSFLMPAVSNRFSAYGYSTWCSVAAYIPVFGFSFVLAGFFDRKMPMWLRLLVITGVICVVLPIACMVFNMFSESYMRHSYGMMLFLVLATLWFLEYYDEKQAKKSIWLVLGGWILLLGVYYLLGGIEKLVPAFRYLLGREGEEGVEQKFRVFGLAITSLMYLVLLALVYGKKIRAYIIPVTVSAIVLYGCGYTVMNLESSHLLDYYPETTMDLQTQVERYFLDVPDMEEGNDYRIDASKQLRNYTYVAKRPSISIFESVRSKYSNELCQYLNYYNGGVMVFPQDDDNETRTLLGAKYYYDLCQEDNIPVPEGFSYMRTENDVKVYQNENFCGIGFSYDSYITRTEFEKIAKNEESNGDIMLQTLVVEDEDVPLVDGFLKPYQKGTVCKDRISFDEVSMTSDGLSAKIFLEKPRIMYLAVPYEDTGWYATCNGKELDFFRANVGMIAFPLDAGENEITFRYQLPSDQLGRYVTCVGWIALLVYVMIRERKRGKKEEM